MGDQLLADMRLTRAAMQVDMVHDGLLAATRAAQMAGPTASDAAKAAVRTELADFDRTLAEAQAEVARGLADPAVRQAELELRPLVGAYVRTATQLVDAALAGGDGLATLRQEMDLRFKQLEQALDQFSGLIADQAARRVAARDALSATHRWQTLGVATTMVAVLLLMGLHFVRGMHSLLGAEPHALGEFAQGIADGVLYTHFDTPPVGDRSVAAALVQMRDRLGEAVSAIRSGAESVVVGSTQIATGNHDLADRTHRQASSLEAAALRMADVTDSVQQTAAHARSATALAAGSSAVAQRGGAAVQQVQATMADIDAASRRVVTITDVIDGIAAQTSILALNAAVEASRAGEHGQGFAVVAAEVRSLAQRSAAAAREIRQLIDASLARVADGNRQVADAGATMGEIVDQVARVNALVDAISSAAALQSGGIAQVGQSVAALDQHTQQNAALVEESATAAAMLRDQATRLADAVGAFRLRQPA